MQDKDFIPVERNKIYRLNINKNEKSFIYPKNNAGVIFVDYYTLLNQNHNSINFYQLNKESVLCEIKPFIEDLQYKEYELDSSKLRFIENQDYIHIYFNGMYLGSCDGKIDKFIKLQNKCGLVNICGRDKNLIVFDKDKIIFNNKYIDYESNSGFIQIYNHIPNIFNIGKLTKYDLKNKTVVCKFVVDNGQEVKCLKHDFEILYFIDSIKIGRYDLAYSKLSYELRNQININVLKDYFNEFDNYIYLNEEDVFITLKNNKVISTCHLVVNNGFIDKIY